MPLAFAACTHAGCDAAPRSPFDLYCDAPEPHFLVLGDRPRVQVTAVYAARGGLGLLVLLTAAWSTPIPLYAIAAIVGTALLTLPLRHFMTSQVVAPIVWAGALAFALATREARVADTVRDAILGGGIALVLVALLGAAALEDHERVRDRVTRSLVLALALALSAVLAGLAVVVLGIGSVGGPVLTVLALLFSGGVGSALGGAVLAGALWGAPRVVYQPRLTPRDALRARQLGSPPGAGAPRRAPTNGAERMAAVLQPIAQRIAVQLVDIVNLLLRAAYAFVNAVFETVRRVAHRVRVLSVRVALRIAAAARVAAETLVAALLVLAAVVERWAAGTLLVAVVATASAEGSVIAAQWFASYLDGASVAEGVGSLGLALAAAAGLVAVWWGLTRWAPRDVLGSAARLLELAGPGVFLTLVVLGWVDGLAGLIGPGSLRPGWLTLGGTVVVIVSVVWGYRVSEAVET